ncbi:MAG: hypothetical protein J0I95_12765, partial [Microbacterium sp.]|uniref:hypothetical protein n=1 Tax=Microbacterium sp. TaxID=51671 RepID=UPI001AC1BC70
MIRPHPSVVRLHIAFSVMFPLQIVLDRALGVSANIQKSARPSGCITWTGDAAGETRRFHHEGE